MKSGLLVALGIATLIPLAGCGAEEEGAGGSFGSVKDLSAKAKISSAAAPAPFIRPFFQPNGEQFQLKRSGSVRSFLTNMAREKLVQEYWQLKHHHSKGLESRTMADLYRHYQVSQQSAAAVVKASSKSTSAAAKKRGGRPRVFGKEAEEMYVQLQRGARRPQRRLRGSARQ